MPRASIDAVVEQQLDDAGATGRYLDLRVDFERKATGDLLWTTGGLWDRRDKRYDGEATRRRVMRVHDGQLEAAEWFGRWIAARSLDEFLYENGKTVFSVGLIGGRRAGKSNLGIRVALAYAVEFPTAIVWLVLPSYPDMPEVQRELELQMPAGWYTYHQEKGLFLYSLANGSEIHIKSSHYPKDLKRGRCDLAVIHEAQEHAALAYGILRPAIADRGGLVVLIANPPDDAKGEWVAEWVEKVKTGLIGGKLFVLDPARNTELKSLEALSSLEAELDDRTFRREIKGEFLPHLDRVFYDFSLDWNIEKMPDHLGVTMPFLYRKLGVEATAVHGMDFQKDPYQAALSLRFFEDPADPAGDPLVWIFDETLVEQGLEDDLVKMLERHGHRGSDWVDDRGARHPGDAVIADASGEWQNSERTKGRASWDRLREGGWHKLFKPDEAMEKNPPITERIAVGNSLIKSADGQRKLRVDPRCPRTIESIRKWENRNGVPYRRSRFAHLADCWTYPAYRLFPRRAPNPPVEYTRVERERSGRRRDLDVW